LQHFCFEHLFKSPTLVGLAHLPGEVPAGVPEPGAVGDIPAPRGALPVPHVHRA